MIKRIDTIAADLAALLQEGAYPQDALPADIDPGIPLHRYVVLLFPEALSQQIEGAERPCSYTVPIPGNAIWDSPYGGYLPLPSDFLRLGEFRLPDWPRPMVSVADGPDGPVIRWFGSNAYGSQAIYATYTPRPRFDHFGGIRVPPEHYIPALRAVASLIQES